MSLLAEIWHDRGDEEQARELLTDCLRKLVTEFQESKFNYLQRWRLYSLRNIRKRFTGNRVCTWLVM